LFFKSKIGKVPVTILKIVVFYYKDKVVALLQILKEAYWLNKLAHQLQHINKMIID